MASAQHLTPQEAPVEGLPGIDCILRSIPYRQRDLPARRDRVALEQVKEAAKEAVKGVGYDVLMVCGFAFYPHVNEEARNFGKLVVLPTRMNPDLAMGDELLMKTGAGNLFMVFGEPDVEIRKTQDGRVEVEIHGLDVYDPTTGVARNSSTDDHDPAPPKKLAPTSPIPRPHRDFESESSECGKLRSSLEGCGSRGNAYAASVARSHGLELRNRRP